MLIDKSISGDKQAFEKLMSSYLGIIYNYIKRKVSGDEDLKDIVQEIMLAVWQSLKNFDGNSSFKTWVLSIARRKIADFYRNSYKSCSNQNEDILEYSDIPDTEDNFQKVADKLSIASAVYKLDNVDKEIVYLVFYAQLSYSEVSAITKLPIGTIKSKMSAIKSKLKKHR